MGPILDAHSLLHPLAEDIEYTCGESSGSWHRRARVRPTKNKEDNWGYCSDIYRVCCKRFDGMELALNMSKLPGWIYEEAQSAAFDGKGSWHCAIYVQPKGRLYRRVRWSTQGLDIKAKRK